MSDEIKTVEVPVAAEPQKKADLPTRDQLKEKGWSSSELENAEKRGMIAKPEGEKKEPEKVEQKEPVKGEEKKDPNFLDAMDKELTPEQEKMFLELFPPGTKPRAFYFRAKNERHARQRAEGERDKLALELQIRRDSETRATKGEPEQEFDTEGNPIDPEDKPLTMKQLRALQKAEMDALNKQKDELETRSGKVAKAMEEQEEFAKSTIPDFEDTVKLAKDVVENIATIADPIKRSKVLKLVRDLQITAAQADKYGVDDYTASMIAYELGQMHPEYGKKTEKNGDEKKADPKVNGEPKLTPDQMKRIEENTQRRAPSAALPGMSNGKKTVAVDDLNIKDVLSMSPEERYKLKKEHPEVMAKLMRG